MPLMVGFNRRFDPNFALLERANPRPAASAASELLTITSRDPAPPPIEYVRRSGGLFRDMMIHDFDMARWLLDEEPVEVFAAASVLVDPAIGEAGDVDTAVVTLRTQSGALCQISNSRRAIYGYDQRIEALGSKGALRAENVVEALSPLPGPMGSSATSHCISFSNGMPRRTAASSTHFIGAIASGAAPLVGGRRRRQWACALADAGLESFRTGRAVRI